MSPAPQRNALAALFALRAELQAIPERVSDPGIARIKLDWWRNEIDRLFAGEPRHPLSEILAPVVTEHHLPQPAFIDLIEGVERILRAHRHLNQEAQRQSDEQDLGALFELLARCEGADVDVDADADADADNQGQLITARRTGGWCAQVRRIRDAGLLLRSGREVLPADQLTAARLSHGQLASTEGRQRLPALLQPIAEQLRAATPDQVVPMPICIPKAGWKQKQEQEQEQEQKPELQQTQPSQASASPQRSQRFGPLLNPKTDRTLARLTPALRVQLRLHQDLLNVLERSGFNVADQRISLTPLRKFWLAWRATTRGSAVQK
ncbi:MAG: hypothetical protein C1943_10275 [Halochromatium sp.]|nr:hypothetical protein [Halochromatium sp.]